MKNFFSIIVTLCLIFGFSTSLMAQDSSNINKNDYFGSGHYVDGNVARAMINNFPHHKPHFLGGKKKKLTDAYARFDITDLQSVVNHRDKIDSVVFKFAAWTEKTKGSFPTVLMACYMKQGFDKKFNAIQYIGPISYCPPPTDGCAVKR